MRLSWKPYTLLLIALIALPAQASLWDECRLGWGRANQAKVTIEGSGPSLSDSQMEAIMGVDPNVTYQGFLLVPGAVPFPLADASRKAYNYLGSTNFTAREKALLWERFAVLIRKHNFDFTSTHHRGSDGSYVFQGGKDRIILVISPDGSVFRGEAKNALYGTEIWPADYQNLRRVPYQPAPAP